VIGNDGETWYRHRWWVARPPASNVKLLLSMALLQRFEPGRTIRTLAMAPRLPANGVLRGDLWLAGRGDPEIDADDLAELAHRLKDAGLRKVRGHVLGATTPFVRDWWAPGWRDYFPDVYIPRPTALTFRGNVGPSGRHVPDPEARAANELTKALERIGIPVRKRPGTGRPPSGLRVMAELRSDPLWKVMRRMNRRSINLSAEVLGKYLGGQRFGRPSIAGGARAIHVFLANRQIRSVNRDSSGLSYDNRITASSIVRLLWWAQDRPWGDVLRSTLPTGGQGTMRGRLEKLRLRVKTGTLIDVSALSGWIWLERTDEWAEFSILSSHIDDERAKRIENQILRVVAAKATDPSP
jgi:D-alanyl-D-alanine carboxypeptidase/D-alanyl-D-alanine-endopeptidase (penicillin-binding protein 4)